MASLGDHFPNDLRRDYLEASLKPGCVVKLEIKFPEITKSKYLVLASIDDPEYFTFLINSDINQFIKNKQHLLDCQVPIMATDHSFLNHDSYIACHEIYPLKREDVIKSLLFEPSAIKGNISLDIKEQIIKSVILAKTISKDKKDRIISSLEK